MTSTNILTGIGSVFEKNKRAIKVILWYGLALFLPFYCITRIVFMSALKSNLVVSSLEVSLSLLSQYVTRVTKKWHITLQFEDWLMDLIWFDFCSMFCPIFIWMYFIYKRDIFRAGHLSEVLVHGRIYMLRWIFQLGYLSCMILARVRGDILFRAYSFQRIKLRK